MQYQNKGFGRKGLDAKLLSPKSFLGFCYSTISDNTCHILSTERISSLVNFQYLKNVC